MTIGLLLLSLAHGATFDWGSDCSSGSGDFQDYIGHQALEHIGNIPMHKENVRIQLDSDADVDIQVIDPETGITVIGWPDGYLSGPTEECMNYEGLEYCYSGYNGVDGLGDEWIELRGRTNRPLEMYAFGYQRGDAQVDYRWEASNTCNEWGRGTFEKSLRQGQVSTIGSIPSGKVNVYIQLDADEDLDIQLFDGDTKLVQWPDGMLAGPEIQTLDYQGMHVEWSGYNGTPKGLGHEYVRITGRVSRELDMKAYAYQAGTADVFYEWGVGAGDACGSRGLPSCDGGLVCKGGNPAVDVPGECHTEMWCESDTTAANDCANVPHIMVPGQWTCEEFSCAWDTALVTDLAGVGESCEVTSDCEAGLMCMGALAYDGHGIECVDDSMYGTFAASPEVSIPDGSQAGVTSSVEVAGLASVPVDMVVKLDLDHPRKSDLRVTLEDPNGDVAVIWDREANPEHKVVVDNGIPGDDSVNGTWTLKVQDMVTGQTGVLHDWSFFVVSRWD